MPETASTDPLDGDAPVISRRTMLGAAVASFVVLPAVATSALPFTFAAHRFAVRELPIEISPYYSTKPVPVEDTGVHDAIGVRMFLKDGKLYNHPVAQTQYGLALLESFRITGNRTYLERARMHALRLWDTRVVRSDAWFYPYRFAFTMHGRGPGHRPPWYSMMAQGRALSFFIRLYRVTGDEDWAVAAHNTFHSFLLPPAVGKPWGVHVVDDHLVLDEYPDPMRIRGDLTYNGHNYSAFGLYDYWVWTRNADALLLLQGAMTTTRDWSARYRRPGWRSRYCLTHGGDAGRYHGVHMRQFAQLYAISGDGYFAQLADTYYDDYPPGPTPGSVRLAAGRHTGCKFDSAGLVTASKTLRLNEVSSAPSSGRQKVVRQPGIWHGITAGGLAGYQVQENPPTRYQIGAHTGLSYLVQRPATIRSAAPKAYTVDQNGTTTSVTTTYRAGDPVTVNYREVLNGGQYARLADGPYTGRWLPLAAVAFS